jgi:hypothetical protein
VLSGWWLAIRSSTGWNAAPAALVQLDNISR